MLWSLTIKTTSVKLSLALLYGLGNSLFFQTGFIFAFPRHLWILSTQYDCKLNSYLSFVLRDHINVSKFKLQTGLMPGLCCECSGNASFIYFFPSPRANAKAEKFPLHLPLQAGLFFFFSGLLSSSLFHLLGALDDISRAKHGNGKSKEPAHNLLAQFSRITFAFKELI